MEWVGQAGLITKGNWFQMVHGPILPPQKPTAYLPLRVQDQDCAKTSSAESRSPSLALDLIPLPALTPTRHPEGASVLQDRDADESSVNTHRAASAFHRQ